MIKIYATQTIFAIAIITGILMGTFNMGFLTNLTSFLSGFFSGFILVLLAFIIYIPLIETYFFFGRLIKIWRNRNK